MEDANMEDAPLQIESGPHDIDMEAAVQSDPLELLMKALPAQDSAMLQILLPMSIQECEPLIGKTRSLNDLSSLRIMLTVAHTIIYKYRQSHATLPDGCEVWRSLSEVPSLDSWYGTKKPIKVLGSPGLTVASLLDQLAKASRSKLEVKHDVNPDQRAKDFSKQFLGQGVHYLHRHILGVRKAFDYHTHYAPIIPIIQSSGTGKSKTAVQLAQLELGFFTCVRKQSKNVSEPRGDDQVAPWLNSPRQVESAESRDADVDKAGSNHLATLSPKTFKEKTDWKYRYAHRVAMWVLFFAEELSEYHRQKWLALYGEEIKNPVDVSTPFQMERWNRFKDAVALELSPVSGGTPARMALLASIDTKCRAELVTWEKNHHEVPLELQSGPVTNYRNGPALRNLITRAAGSWRALESILPSKGTDFFHLTIDECGQMGNDNLTCLQSQFNSMELERSFILLIDTNTQISMLAGDEDYSASLRKLGGKLIPCEPFSSLPQDLGMITHRDAFMKICEGSNRSRSYESLKEYLPLMGRPLWADSWLRGRLTKGGGPPSSHYAGVDLEAVCRKLSGPAYTVGALEDSNAIIAFLTQRLPLKISGYQGKHDTDTFTRDFSAVTGKRPDCRLASLLVGVTSFRKFTGALVEHHLRRLEKILPQQGAIQTNTPSEPILRHAYGERLH
jgi:hypothetical protein